MESAGLSRISVKNKNPLGFSPICAKAITMIDKFSDSAQAPRHISSYPPTKVGGNL